MALIVSVLLAVSESSFGTVWKTCNPAFFWARSYITSDVREMEGRDLALRVKLLMDVRGFSPFAPHFLLRLEEREKRILVFLLRLRELSFLGKDVADRVDDIFHTLLLHFSLRGPTLRAPYQERMQVRAFYMDRGVKLLARFLGEETMASLGRRMP